MSPAQRWVVSPNNDTIYGVGFADLTRNAVVVQTPTDVPAGHYWTVRIVDVLTDVVHQLGSAAGTPGGKFLLVGPTWEGNEPAGFVGVLRMPTNVAGVIPRSFPRMSDSDTPMADQARTLVALHRSGESYRALLDLPPVDRSRGGLWSLTMYDKDAFMLAGAPRWSCQPRYRRPRRRRPRVPRRDTHPAPGAPGAE
ncbi:DUF1254 domain-containing protein [Rhodococcus sp. USK10]|uniref:DUF1254 domain-containing protein n=1 Tax=Rhodococcus sp. USK10 TaxID=2789739 RepID=UPI002151E73E|nr:DUF1254 domain-containing protein [Rhodococcus sp. USK10]